MNMVNLLPHERLQSLLLCYYLQGNLQSFHHSILIKIEMNTKFTTLILEERRDKTCNSLPYCHLISYLLQHGLQDLAIHQLPCHHLKSSLPQHIFRMFHLDLWRSYHVSRYKTSIDGKPHDHLKNNKEDRHVK